MNMRKTIYKNIIHCFLLLLGILFSMQSQSATMDVLEKLQRAYPNEIKSVNDKYIVWNDGTKMLVGNKSSAQSNEEKLDSPSLIDQLSDASYPVGKPPNFSSFSPTGDPGRIRYTPFFLKMYGQSQESVKEKLTIIYWMPKVFGQKFPLEVTTVNSVDKKLSHVSDELQQLVVVQPKFLKYLDHPAGTFKWRAISDTSRLSAHSFGIAMDINAQFSNYWQWDLEHHHEIVSENTQLTYQNDVPWEIVNIFEKNGFIWGGKWYHYDTMHFEYRPELLAKCNADNSHTCVFCDR